MTVSDIDMRWVNPAGFRSGQWARVIGVVLVTSDVFTDRPCYALRYSDGVVDYVSCQQSAADFELRRVS